MAHDPSHGSETHFVFREPALGFRRAHFTLWNHAISFILFRVL